jgi:hypothetical protein
VGSDSTGWTSREILRLQAEWDPSEAVVITWPVLHPGFWDFYRDLVSAIARSMPQGPSGSITPIVTMTATSGEGCEGRCLPVSLRACLDTSPFWS